MLFMLTLLLNNFMKSGSKIVLCLGTLHAKYPGVKGFRDLKIYGLFQR